LPLSEKLRIEVFLPDNPDPAYKALLKQLQQEFTYSFGGCSVISGLEGQYRSDANESTIVDRVHLLFVDTDLEYDPHQEELTQYLHHLYRAAYEALDEEAILISVYQVAHVNPPDLSAL
jgi:hypothetical protein